MCVLYYSIKEVQDEAEKFNQALKAYATTEQEKFSESFEKDGENAEMYQEIKENDALIELYSDKEILVSALEASRENVDNKISDKDTEITRAISEDWALMSNRITEEQQRRNRDIIEEIINTCQNFKEDIGKHSFIHHHTHTGQ